MLCLASSDCLQADHLGGLMLRETNSALVRVEIRTLRWHTFVTAVYQALAVRHRILIDVHDWLHWLCSFRHGVLANGDAAVAADSSGNDGLRVDGPWDNHSLNAREACVEESL